LDRTYAFVDESGNSDLDTSKKGSSGFFVVYSILVAEKDLEAEIIDHLQDRGFGELTDQKIRSSGIAKLRDADVIITSSAKGYKIPQTRADIQEFLERASGIVVPLLERVKRAQRIYQLSSLGEYDIVKAANLTELAKLIDSLEAFAND
jgi:hypothetical protein